MDVVWFSGWSVIWRTLIAGSITYLALVALLRITGPRTLAKWYAFDLIVTVALGSTFANGVLSKDIAITQALTGFVLLVALQYVIGRIAVRHPRFIQVVNPAPVLLLINGELQQAAMDKNRVTRADVCKAVRSNGEYALENVAAVVLEPDGSFSVIGRIERSSMSASALEDVPQYKKLFEGGENRGSQGADQGAIV
jgi:uncharacterized membrane protein YcaP (DUF421 family)